MVLSLIFLTEEFISFWNTVKSLWTVSCLFFHMSRIRKKKWKIKTQDITMVQKAEIFIQGRKMYDLALFFRVGNATFNNNNKLIKT